MKTRKEEIEALSQEITGQSKTEKTRETADSTRKHTEILPETGDRSKTRHEKDTMTTVRNNQGSKAPRNIVTPVLARGDL